MKLTDRDRKVLMAGAGLAVFIVFVGCVLLPIGRKWVEMGDRLAPKLEDIAALKDRVELLTRRNALARRMGSLAGVEAPAEKGDSEKSPAKSAKKAHSEKKGDSEQTESKTKDDSKGEAKEATSTDKDDGGAEEKEVDSAGEEPDEEASSNAEESQDADDKSADATEGDSDEPHASKPKKADDALDTEQAAEETENEPNHTSDGQEEKAENTEASKEDRAEGDKENDAEAKAGAKEGADKNDKKNDAKEKTESAEKAEDVRLAAYVERVSQQAGVKFKRITPKALATGAKSAKSFSAMAAQFSVEGNIQGIVKLLHALEKGERFVRIEQLQLQRNTEKGETIEASLDVMAYKPEARIP